MLRNKLVNFPKIMRFESVFHSRNYQLLDNFPRRVYFENYCTQHSILYEVLKLRDKNTTNSIIDSNVNEVCNYYKSLSQIQKHDFILELSKNYAVHHKDVCAIANTIVREHCNQSQSLRIQEKLKTALTPIYKWLFIHVGRQENGVKFLVDMRTEILELLRKIDITDPGAAYMQQLNITLRELFLLWFSVGFLKLERITWKSSCAMLEKISDYEAVHPVRNWPDLKKRMGPDRRCFVYTHSSMPEEPLVILHTALRNEIADSTINLTAPNTNVADHQSDYDSTALKAAVFYSISSTQVGLQGIELGNYIIKRVANEIVREFPQINQFSSLSPIPMFKTWLFDQFKRANNDSNYRKDVLKDEELNGLKHILKSTQVFAELMKQLNGNEWLKDQELVHGLKPILMRLCIKYLYVEKKRGYALDNVANFHLRNGAEMWRINWLADLSPRGLSTSCGIMVNYRYYLEDADNNSKSYIENKNIKISLIIKELLDKTNLG